MQFLIHLARLFMFIILPCLSRIGLKIALEAGNRHAKRWVEFWRGDDVGEAISEEQVQVAHFVALLGSQMLPLASFVDGQKLLFQSLGAGV
jgi:hypothetical protein